jgi:fructose-1,6-bisphosphatase I
MSSTAVTLSRYILNAERNHPALAGELSVLLAQIGFAVKILSREIGRAALVGRLGLVGDARHAGSPCSARYCRPPPWK